jgi:hypothetical protein
MSKFQIKDELREYFSTLFNRQTKYNLKIYLEKEYGRPNCYKNKTHHSNGIMSKAGPNPLHRSN